MYAESVLEKAKWLDPRDKVSQPIFDSVNIPFADLPHRVFELPSRKESILVANAGPEAQATLDWLIENGYGAAVGRDFEMGGDRLKRLWSPNPFLESILPEISRGSALDVACGSGRDAVFMASAGFQVTGIDHLPDAIAFAQTLSTRYLPPTESIRLIAADLDETQFVERYDLVTCFFYLNRTFLRRLKDLINPGGSFVMETFTSVNRETHGKPRSEKFVLQPNELLGLLDGFEVLRYEEDWHADRHTAQIWALRSGQDHRDC